MGEFAPDPKEILRVKWEGRVIGDCQDWSCVFRRYGGSPASSHIGEIVDAAEQLNDDIAHQRDRSVKEVSARKIMLALSRILELKP